MPESSSHNSPAETLEGRVERIVFANPENGWTVARLTRGDGSLPVDVVGVLMGVEEGDHVRIEGHWKRDKKFGLQFHVRSYLPILPATAEGMEAFLASGRIRGVGKVMARRLVRHFGAETIRILDEDSARLEEVPGIGPVRRERIERSWADQVGVRDVMLFLHGHGVTPSLANKIFHRYGNDSVSFLQENPYRLAAELHGVGFRTADQLASRLGFARDSPRRREAGVLHILATATDKGHLFLPESRLASEARELLSVDPSDLEPVLEELSRSDRIVLDPLPHSDRGHGEDRAVYPAFLYAAELELAKRAGRFVGPTGEGQEERIKDLVRHFQEKRGIHFAPEQQKAVERALAERLLIVTGGPGTGKTTLVRALVEILRESGRQVLLAAPTGRAAKRLAEATGSEAKTIHRLLEYNPRTFDFQRGPARPLQGDLAVIDEVSMLDVSLAYHLFRALPRNGRIVLVGDDDQLPSVGPGRVLGDLIASKRIPVVRLTRVFRQARESLIITNAHRIRQGQMPEARPAKASPDFFLVERSDPGKTLETLITLVTDRIPARYGFDPADEIQTLTPMRKGILGAANLNLELQALINPNGGPAGPQGRGLRTGDRVMQIRNNYQLETFNGDLGRIEDSDHEEQLVRIRFDRRLVGYDFNQLDEITLAYACTVHKAQGSEYTCVVMPLTMQHAILLQRNLLYTAVTRGRQLVILVGSQRALAYAIRRATQSHRFTRLAERLRAAARDAD